MKTTSAGFKVGPWLSCSEPHPAPHADRALVLLLDGASISHLHSPPIPLSAASSGPSHLQPRCRGSAVAAESEGEYQCTGECCPALQLGLHSAPAVLPSSAALQPRGGRGLMKGFGVGSLQEAQSWGLQTTSGFRHCLLCFVPWAPSCKMGCVEGWGSHPSMESSS